MDINKFNEAKRLVERIKSLDVVCNYGRISKYSLAFEKDGLHSFEVDEALREDVVKLAKSLKEKLEQELREL
ncbi:MAG: hypothetical protein HXN33_07090 [Prevotella histicola]|uniref:Uncharacterized protein n=1 Tax=Prevotella histicola TaxID=470565 RepID=A0A930I015_9BACT|nr:hypothetical protein [Prevotella histicola]